MRGPIFTDSWTGGAPSPVLSLLNHIFTKLPNFLIFFVALFPSQQQFWTNRTLFWADFVHVARSCRIRSSAMRRRHSAKPDKVRARIAAMFPGQKKIELFARQQTPGWTAWGFDVAEHTDKQAA